MRGVTKAETSVIGAFEISTLTPCEGRDPPKALCLGAYQIFQLSRPVRGVTMEGIKERDTSKNFNSHAL